MMSAIDAALVVLLLLCAIRGFWRGLLREGFGFAGLVLGLVAALGFADHGARLLEASLDLPGSASLGASFVLLFVLVSGLLTLFGFLVDRLIAAPSTRALNGVGGALFGLAKGATVLGFALLFFRLFPVVEGIDERILSSPLANPMASVAASVLRMGWQGAPRPAEEA